MGFFTHVYVRSVIQAPDPLLKTNSQRFPSLHYLHTNGPLQKVEALGIN